MSDNKMRFTLKLLIISFFFLTLSFAQAASPNQSQDSHLGQKEHNCDEPCLKCGHKEACKDTKASDNTREIKDVESDKSSDEHQHHNTTQQ